MNTISFDRRHGSVHRALLLASLVVLLAAAHAAAAAATTDCASRAAPAGGVLVGTSLENWEPVNDRTVLIWTGRDIRAHLVRLSRPLAGLSAAEVIDLVDGDHDRRISACGRDGVAIGGGQGDGTLARIVSIELLSYRRTMQLDPGAAAAFPDSLRT